MKLWIYEFKNLWIYESMNLLIYEFMKLWIHEVVNSWIYEYMKLWICEFMNLWIYEFMVPLIYSQLLQTPPWWNFVAFPRRNLPGIELPQIQSSHLLLSSDSMGLGDLENYFISFKMKFISSKKGIPFKKIYVILKNLI